MSSPNSSFDTEALTFRKNIDHSLRVCRQIYFAVQNNMLVWNGNVAGQQVSCQTTLTADGEMETRAPARAPPIRTS
ncbi:MAG TPA: hypothetical protein VE109_08620, partial [Acidobacteriaceae bacterium]|nr:hypothetical protein [Acidobacteriaceae bacterium]